MSCVFTLLSCWFYVLDYAWSPNIINLWHISYFLFQLICVFPQNVICCDKTQQSKPAIMYQKRTGLELMTVFSAFLSILARYGIFTSYFCLFFQHANFTHFWKCFQFLTRLSQPGAHLAPCPGQIGQFVIYFNSLATGKFVWNFR